MKETEQTLFFKSNLLHIRTNEGEYEVSNPEEVPDLIHDKELDIWWLMSPNHSEDPTELTETSRIEWPGGIEKVCSCECQVKPMFCFFDCQQDKTIRIRLLPKEEKKEPFVKALDDIQKIENLSVNNSAHSFTESAYKEGEKVCKNCGLSVHNHREFDLLCPVIHNCQFVNWNYQSCFEVPVSAHSNTHVVPLESENKALSDWKESALAVFAEWDRVSDYIKPRCRLGDKYSARALELFKMIDAENKALKEEINALNGDIQSYRNGHEVNAKRYNDLLIEREAHDKSMSDIKALREENTKCKELSWEAANEISRLKKEIERLEAEVLKEKFPEN